MAYPTKIATCCYCSSRTLLKPTARDGHELACGSCGAPLHEMRWVKSPKVTKHSKSTPARFLAQAPRVSGKKVQRPRNRKKSLFRKVLEEAWDIAEDIFD